MMAPSLREAEAQTPVEALGKADEIGQDLIYVCVQTGVLTTAGVKATWQLLNVWSLVIWLGGSFFAGGNSF